MPQELSALKTVQAVFPNGKANSIAKSIMQTNDLGVNYASESGFGDLPFGIGRAKLTIVTHANAKAHPAMMSEG